MYALVSAIISREGWTDAMQVRHCTDMWSLLDKISEHLRARDKYGEDVGDAEGRLIRTLRNMIGDSGFHMWEDDKPCDARSGEVEMRPGEYSLSFFPIQNTYRIYGPLDYTGIDIAASELDALLKAVSAQSPVPSHQSEPHER